MTGRHMRRSEKRSKIKGKYLVLAIIVVALIILAAMAIVVYLPKKKPSIIGYLTVSHTKSFGEFLQGDTLVNIVDLGLRITAVGGNATSIVVQVDEGMQLHPENDVYKEIPKGNYSDVVIQLEGCYLPLENGKATIHVEISCSQADGHVLLPITIRQEDVVGTHG